MSGLKVILARPRSGKDGEAPAAAARRAFIPERRSAERRRSSSTQERGNRLKRAGEVAGFGIYDLSRSNGEVRLCPEVKLVSGAGEDEDQLAAEPVAELVHPDDRERVRNKIEASLEDHHNGEFEDDHRLLRPDGSVHWVKVKGKTVFAEHGQKLEAIGAVGVVMDLPGKPPAAPADLGGFVPFDATGELAERRRDAEQHLHEKPRETDGEVARDNRRLVHELQVHQVELEMQNEELREARAESQSALQRYAELYDFAPVGYFTLDHRDSAIRQLNLAAASLLGIERGQLVGRRFGLFIDERDRPAFNAFLASRVLAGHARAACEVTLVDPEGRREERFVRIEAALDESGETVNAVVLDITESKRAHEELIRSNLELQQFAFIAAHDLQTPLRSISGFAQLLQQDYLGRLGAEADGWVRQLVASVQRMQTLIQDVLDYARVDSRGRPFQLVDGRQIVDEVLGLLDAPIRENGATVTCDPLPIVKGDRVQLAQVFQNLIDNGIKYRGTEAPRVHVSAQRDDGHWVFTVRDNGIGIASKHHGRIFRIFSRLHSQQEYPGTGIGLAICERIIRRHGGRIWVDSDAGKGCAFHFSLPVPSGS